MCCQSTYSHLRGYSKKELAHNILYLSAGSDRENKVRVLVFITKDLVRIVSTMHNSRIFDHTFELLLPEFRHDVGVDTNTLQLVDETEVLEALAFALLVVVAFLPERFVAMAESKVINVALDSFLDHGTDFNIVRSKAFSAGKCSWRVIRKVLLRVCLLNDMYTWMSISKLEATFRRRDRSRDDDCFYFHPWRNDLLIAFGS